MADKLRFGIIGCGSAAVPVAQALAASPLTALAATYDLSQALARDLAERHGGTAHETLAALLGDTAVDAVYIAVPHYQLAPLAAQALQAGKHALVEKPMALSLADADNLIGLAESRGLGLGVNYDLRQSAQAVQARDLIRAGAIGDILAVHIQTVIDKSPSYWQVGLTGRWPNPWRASKAQAGGGVALMNSSHQLDIVRFVTGLEVTSVSGEIGSLTAPVEVEDTASASLRYDNGAIGSLFAGAHLAGAEPGGQLIELYGPEGQLRLPSLYGSDPLRLFLRRPWGAPALLPTSLEGSPGSVGDSALLPPSFEGSRSRAGAPDLLPPSLEGRGAGGVRFSAGEWHHLPHVPAPIFQATVEAFARAVQRGEPPSPGGRDAREILAIVLGLYRAAEEHAVQRIEHMR